MLNSFSLYFHLKKPLNFPYQKNPLISLSISSGTPNSGMNPPPTDQPPFQALHTDAYFAAMPVVAPPSIANPSPVYGAVAVHPPYAEMIMAAITTLKEQDGSSKKAIARYIEAAYPNLPAAHPALLTHHLKRLKNSGQLVMVKKSYALPPPPGLRSELASPPPVAATPPSLKRGPGRPPKRETPFDPQATVPAISDPSVGVLSTKRRGRPPKAKPAPTSFDYQSQQLQPQPIVYAAEPLATNNANVVQPGLVNGTASLPKRRGRPPKLYRDVSAGEEAQVTWNVTSGASLVKKRPGRPPKAGGRPRGRPRKSVDGFVVAPVRQAPPAGGGMRGRPRKSSLVAVDGGNVVPVGMKRRGRPRKGVAGPSKLRISRSGRPVGRPRKNASTVGANASGQSGVTATVELTRKLEYMQLKVKNAVSLLKPHLINANIIDILTAIQDLEELATMDITGATESVTAPVDEPVAQIIAEQTAPPTDIAAPVDLSAPVYPDHVVVGQLPVTFN